MVFSSLVHFPFFLYNETIFYKTNEGRTNMTYHIPDRLYHDLVRMAKKHQIQKLILFGSRARGTNRERSDVDLAVFGGDFDGFYWDVNENAWSLLSFDLIEYDNGISEELKKEIEKDGITIYEKI